MEEQEEWNTNYVTKNEGGTKPRRKLVFDNNKDKKYNYSQLAKICIHKLSLRGVLRYFGEDVNKLDPTF